MPIASSQDQRIRLDAITVRRGDRQRQSIETADLEDSIRRLGLLQPIIVRYEIETDSTVLIAGERRLEACRRLGLGEIPVRYYETLSAVELQIVELEENVKRKDLEWPELVEAVRRIHGLYCQLDPDWTQAETSSAIGLSPATVSMYLRVAQAGQDVRVADAGTVREAYNVLARRDQRAQGEALEELLGAGTVTKSGTIVTSSPAVIPLQLPESILHTSFLEWAPKWEGPKFNLVHCDFPYGIEAFSGPQMRGSESKTYGDSAETYWKLLDCLLTHFDRLVSVSAHLLFWYSGRQEAATLEWFASRAPSLEFTTFPLVWVKSDNAGVAPDARRDPRHIYETCFMASRGRRNIVRIMADAYSAPTDKRLHPSAKPEPMLRHFMTMLVDSSTVMLDPTCGSGAALRAADSLGAKSVLGLEIDEQYCANARSALRTARALRGASSAVANGGAK